MRVLRLILCVLVGVGVGIWLSRQYFPRMELTDQRDTTFLHDTVRIKEVVTEKVEGPTEYVLVHVRDTIRETDTIDSYFPVLREHYHTMTSEAEIWHSGIDSRIDSLAVFRKTQVITQYVEREPSDWRFSAYLGADYKRGKEIYITPIIGAEIAWKRISAHAEVGVMMNKEIQPYWGVGVRYDLLHR